MNHLLSSKAIPFLDWEGDFLVLFLIVLNCEAELMVDICGLFKKELRRSGQFIR